MAVAPTRVSFGVDHGDIVGIFGLLDALSSSWTPGEGSMGEKGTIDVPCAIASWCRTIHPVEFHCRRCSHRGFVLLNGPTILQDAHFIAVRYWATRSTMSRKTNNHYS